MATKFDADVIIIGAGMAGAMAAYKLAKQGVSVLILEAGDKKTDIDDKKHYEALRKNYVETFAILKDKSPVAPYSTGATDANKFAHSPDVADFSKFDPLKPVYFEQPGPDLFQSQYLRMAGGSTWVWRGNCPRFLPSDFKLKTLFQLDKKFTAVDDWPITYNDIEPFYCEAENEMGVSGNHKEWNGLNNAHRSQDFPMKNIAQAYGDLQVKKKLEGYRVENRTIKITSTPQARNSKLYDGRKACKGNHSCIPVCPTGAKYDGGVHVRKALKAGAKMIDKAVVVKLTVDGTTNLVNGVVYKVWGNNTEVTKRAKIVVLAANAIETPKILLLSGIANSSDQVGRNLMDHLGGEGAALLPFKVFPFRGPQSTSGIEVFRDGAFRKEKCGFRFTVGNDGWGRGLSPMQLLDKIMTEEKLFGSELNKKLEDTITRQFRFSYSTEQLPNKDNRVELSTFKDGFDIAKPKITTTMDDYSINGIKYAQAIIKKLFTKLGAPEETWEFSDIDKRKYSGSGHIMGTCRMGKTKNNSVVDSECKSHDHTNLFIVDSSVFTTGGTANPTLTTAAIALRATDFIIKQLQKL